MNLQLQKSKIYHSKESVQSIEQRIVLPTKISIEGSKSETNRMLILQALFTNIEILNASNSDDCVVMRNALSENKSEINIHHSGTAMRFLTAYFAQKEGVEIILSGSERMHQRPIKILVDALKLLGANIEYIENEGFPPLKIIGKRLIKNKISLDATVSSQYISALLLIAPKLENGLEIELIGEITSIPYINMTLALLNKIGVTTSFNDNIIKVQPTTDNRQPTTFFIESDWSSASYFYSIVALSEIGTEISLSNFKQNSLQGDSILVEIYKDFGVQTLFKNNSIVLRKTTTHNPQPTTHNLKSSPDLAQTIVVTCLGLEIPCHLTGLHTLKIKETDRLLALKIELEKLGAAVQITDNSILLKPTKSINYNTAIDTYNDHRMAMAFAPLVLKCPITINNAEVVSKSYPNFWQDLTQIGVEIHSNDFNSHNL